MVFQNYALWPHLSAVDTVAYPARRRGSAPGSARRQAMAHPGAAATSLTWRTVIPPSCPAASSSGSAWPGRSPGRRALYLFDEPTAHLDTHVRGVFLEELLNRQRDTGAAALYATHDAEEAMGLANRVALLGRGPRGAVGTPEEVYTPASRRICRPADRAGLGTDRSGSAAAGSSSDRTGPASAATGRRVIRNVWFRGPYSDYLLETADGRLLLREPGLAPTCGPGEQVTWTSETARGRWRDQRANNLARDPSEGSPR